MRIGLTWQPLPASLKPAQKDVVTPWLVRRENDSLVSSLHTPAHRWSESTAVTTRGVWTFSHNLKNIKYFTICWDDVAKLKTHITAGHFWHTFLKSGFVSTGCEERENWQGCHHVDVFCFTSTEPRKCGLNVLTNLSPSVQPADASQGLGGEWWKVKLVAAAEITSV